MILYLDIDGVLVTADQNGRRPALGVDDFLEECRDLVTVRWLSTRTPGGIIPLPEDYLETIARDLRCAVKDIQGFENPRKYWMDKTDGIDFDETEPWVWFDDEVELSEIDYLKERGFGDRLIHVDSIQDLSAFDKAWKALKLTL